MTKDQTEEKCVCGVSVEEHANKWCNECRTSSTLDDGIEDILHSFLKECLDEPFEGDPLSRKGRKKRYADMIRSKKDAEIREQIIKEIEELLLSKFDTVEMADPDKSSWAWKNYKFIRNTIRDTLKSLLAKLDNQSK